MPKLTYSEQLRHPNWQRKRLEAMERAAFMCEMCGDTETTLNVHHKRYIKGRLVWEYELDELAVMCEPCHKAEHVERDLFDRLMADSNGVHIQDLTGIAAGYLDAQIAISLELRNEAFAGREHYYDIGVAAAALMYLGPQDLIAVLQKLLDQYPTVPPTFQAVVDRWEKRKT